MKCLTCMHGRQSQLNGIGRSDDTGEHGVEAVTFGSGMAAIYAALLTAGLAPGKKIVVVKAADLAAISAAAKEIGAITVVNRGYNERCRASITEMRVKRGYMQYIFSTLRLYYR